MSYQKISSMTIHVIIINLFFSFNIFTSSLSDAPGSNPFSSENIDRLLSLPDPDQLSKQDSYLQEAPLAPKAATIQRPIPKLRDITDQFIAAAPEATIAQRPIPKLRDITDQFISEAPQLKQMAQTNTNQSDFDELYDEEEAPFIIQEALEDYKKYSLFPTLRSWLAKVNTLRKNRHKVDPRQDTAFSSQDDWDELDMLLSTWFRVQTAGPLSNNKKWLNQTMPQNDFFDYPMTIESFQPFTQKIMVPEGSALIMRGDLHGDIASLGEQLKSLYEEGIINDEFKIIKPNHWIIFLGDYVDRGNYGCEVIYTILRLMIENPDHVIAVRGNHEELNMNARDGFLNEIFEKFHKLGNNTCEQIFNNISRIYDFLPVALYVGCHENPDVTNYAQCCHGGLEIGYNPQPLLKSNATYELINELPTKTNLSNMLANPQALYKDDLFVILSHPNIQDITPNHPHELGFLWNDFNVSNTNQITYNDIRNVGLVYGKDATLDILKEQSSDACRILWVFRGHQHSKDPSDPMMIGLKNSMGVFKLWQPYETTPERSLKDGLVWTFNVGADSEYGIALNFDFDTYAIVTPQKNPVDWTMKVFNQPIFAPRQVISSSSTSSNEKENELGLETLDTVSPSSLASLGSIRHLPRSQGTMFSEITYPISEDETDDDSSLEHLEDTRSLIPFSPEYYKAIGLSPEENE